MWRNDARTTWEGKDHAKAGVGWTRAPASWRQGFAQTHGRPRNAAR